MLFLEFRLPAKLVLNLALYIRQRGVARGLAIVISDALDALSVGVLWQLVRRVGIDKSHISPIRSQPLGIVDNLDHDTTASGVTAAMREAT